MDKYALIYWYIDEFTANDLHFTGIRAIRDDDFDGINPLFDL